MKEYFSDCVIVGTGIGGSTLGFELAKAGRKVLFLEAGRNRDRQSLYHPQLPELLGQGDTHFAKAGRSKYRFYNVTKKAMSPLCSVPMLGIGAGGSSALFGMAMERMHRSDFENYASDDKSRLACSWPFSYDAFEHYYQQAESLYRVAGDRDPLRFLANETLRPAPGLSEGNKRLKDFLVSKQISPYRLPMSCKFSEGCGECQGSLCSKDCKVDAYRAALLPALKYDQVSLFDHCRINKIIFKNGRATALEGTMNGQPVRIKGNHFFLGAGALHTPAILQSSELNLPQIGKGLMRHMIELFVLNIKLKPEALAKELAFTDLGCCVQSFGRLPPPEFIVQDLINNARLNKKFITAYLLKKFSYLIERFIAMTLHNRIILASIIEENPANNNFVNASRDSNALSVHYQMSQADRCKMTAIRRKLVKLLEPFKVKVIKDEEGKPLFGHACGTCRMGMSKEDSVVDENYRVHTTTNVYVTDASIFPRSGSQNPSLTIAANAIRCAELFVKNCDPR